MSFTAVILDAFPCACECPVADFGSLNCVRRYRASALLEKWVDPGFLDRWVDASANGYDAEPSAAGTTGYAVVPGSDASAPNGHPFLSLSGGKYLVADKTQGRTWTTAEVFAVVKSPGATWNTYGSWWGGLTKCVR